MKTSKLIEATRQELKELIITNARNLASLYGDTNKAVEITDEDMGVTPTISVYVESASSEHNWYELRYVRYVNVSDYDKLSIGVESSDDISIEYFDWDKLTTDELVTISTAIESQYIVKSNYNKK